MRHQLPLRYIDEIARVGSIRKAAESLSITSTALNRRVLAFEEDLGCPIFERLPQGVRLSSAGEVVLQHFRSQLADMERVKTQISDMAKGQRGHVGLVSSQAAMIGFLPEMLSIYRESYPAVTFDVRVCNRHAAEQHLAEFTADLAIVFEPDRFTEFHTLVDVGQPINLICNTEHPLAKNTTVRLSECVGYDMVLPTSTNGVRHMLDRAAIKSAIPLKPMIESDNHDFINRLILENDLISFQIALGVPKSEGRNTDIVSVAVDNRDVPPGRLYVGQLRGRTLPVAAALFAEQLSEALNHIYGSK